MTKRRSNKKEKLKKKVESKPAKSEYSDEEKSFDFGGLPMRDLKKNLGC